MKARYPLFAFLLPVLFIAAPTRTVQAQNLIPNPSFDIQDSCPAVSELFVAQPWDTPTPGSPDAFNSTCPSQNSAGHTGIGSAGVFTYSTFPNSREYMQAPLLAPLNAGQTYCASFYVRRANFLYSCDRIGLHVRSGAYSSAVTSPIPVIPEVENPAGNDLGGTGWHLVSGLFTASGGEDHVIIGNFRDDANTNNIIANPGSTNNVCYYYVDDVIVESCNVGIEELAASEVRIYPQPAQDRVQIELPRDIGEHRLELTDMSGRLVMALTTRGIRTTMDLTAVPAGSYLLMIRTDLSVTAKHLIVE